VARLPVVAIVNTNPDLVELLRMRMEAAGFVAIVIHVADIRAGLDLGAVVAQHQPQVIVYDVVMPYESNWVPAAPARDHAQELPVRADDAERDRALAPGRTG